MRKRLFHSKKMASVGIAAALAVSSLGLLAGCGSSTDGTGGNTEAVSAVAETGTTETTETASGIVSGTASDAPDTGDPYVFTGFETVDDNELNEDGLYEFDFPLVLWSDPVYIADAEGIFAKYGLKINFSGTLATNDIVTTVATGEIPFGCMHANAISIGISKGFPIKAVAAGWATSTEKPMLQILVKKDSDIQSIEDLKGRTIAMTDPTQTYWWECKDQYGLTDSVEEVYMNMDEMEAALLTDKVDAVYFNTPYPEKMLNDGTARSLITAVDIVGEEKGWPQQIVNTDFLAEHPDIVRSYVASLADACDWAREHPEQAGVDVARALDIPEEDGVIYNPVFPEHALVDEENAQLWIDLAGKYGFLDRDVTTEEVYTNEYNPYYEGN